MSAETVLLRVVVVLAGLLIYCQWYWSRQVQKLVDKLMSRNFADYTHAQQPPVPRPATLPAAEPVEDLAILEGVHVS